MNKLCKECKCILTDRNTARKDGKRLRPICRKCYGKKRSIVRMNKIRDQKNNFQQLINRKIVKIDFNEKKFIDEKNDFGLMIRGINCIKDFIGRICDGVQ